MRRCFIAIKIPANNAIHSLYQKLREELKSSRINWVKPENLHFTLAFLAEISDEQVGLVSNILNNISSDYPPFDFEITGLGHFGSLQNPTAIWLGIKASPILHKVKIALDSGLRITGYIPDSRPFQAHLTLGRIKSFRSGTEFSRLLNIYTDTVFMAKMATTLDLFESKLSDEGPTYQVLQEFDLKG